MDRQPLLGCLKNRAHHDNQERTAFSHYFGPKDGREKILYLECAHSALRTRTQFFILVWKSGNFFVRTYPCGVSIQRSLMGKLALCGQNFDWTHPVQEKAQKPLKIDPFQKRSNFRGFWAFS